jgi:hypothetical protein
MIISQTDSILATTKSDPWVFREGRKTVSARNEIEAFGRTLSKTNTKRHADCLDLLIWGGELESALSDVQSSAASTLARVVDGLASLLYGRRQDCAELTTLSGMLEVMSLPESITLSRAEGFAYYALQPDDFVRAAEKCFQEERTALIGIRSIGSTLSAVVTAALKAQGKIASRITVRPTGHPYDRVTTFDRQQASWVENENLMGSKFLVVDEGPGRSGSTFLSVADSLVHRGVPPENITLLGSREPDVFQLTARNAAERWQEYRFVAAVAKLPSLFSEGSNLSGGAWRDNLFPNLGNWPACWPQMERMKWLAADRQRLFKFEGLGRSGEEVRERAGCLAEAGFSPKFKNAGSGLLEYPVIPGRPISASEVSSDILEWIARYCAFRASEFRIPNRRSESLGEMLRFNLQNDFKAELGNECDALDSEATTIVDGRMLPHEWIVDERGQVLKMDGVSHGDDHFFPGPCDIAWDLAGVAVEWNLAKDGVDFLCTRFHRLSGRDVAKTIPLFQLAYAAFRHGICEMAISTVGGLPDETLLASAKLFYKQIIQRQLPLFRTTDESTFEGNEIAV